MCISFQAPQTITEHVLSPQVGGKSKISPDNTTFNKNANLFTGPEFNSVKMNSFNGHPTSPKIIYVPFQQCFDNRPCDICLVFQHPSNLKRLGGEVLSYDNCGFTAGVHREDHKNGYYEDWDDTGVVMDWHVKYCKKNLQLRKT